MSTTGLVGAIALFWLCFDLLAIAFGRRLHTYIRNTTPPTPRRHH
jgi:hypothetical protein